MVIRWIGLDEIVFRWNVSGLLLLDKMVCRWNVVHYIKFNKVNKQ